MFRRDPNRRYRILKFVAWYININLKAPTIMEIGERFGLASTASVHGNLVQLESEGLIRRTRKHRGIEIVRNDNGS